MLTLWSRIGGAVLLVFVLGLLTKGVADVGELKGTINALVGRVGALETEMNSRFISVENRFEQVESRIGEVGNRIGEVEERMETRLVRIENILLGRAPDAGGWNNAVGPAAELGASLPGPDRP